MRASSFQNAIGLLPRGKTLDTFLFRQLGTLSSVIVTIATAHMGTAERGWFVIVTLYLSLFCLFFSGLGTLGARKIALGYSLPLMIASTVRLAFCLGIVGLTLLFVLHALKAASFVWTVGLLGCPFIIFHQISIGFLLGQGKIFRLNMLSVLPNLLGAILMVCTAFLGELTLNFCLIYWILGYFASSLLYFILAEHKPSFENVFYRSEGGNGSLIDRADLRFTASATASNLVTLLNRKGDIWIVHTLLGPSAAGIYSIAVALAEILWSISVSLSITLYSEIGHATRSAARALTIKGTKLSYRYAALLSLLMAIVTHFLLTPIFGDSYEPAVAPFLIIALGVLAYSPAAVLSAFYTNQLGEPKLPLLFSLISTVINLALTLALTPRFGIIGAGIGSTLGYLAGISISLTYFLTSRQDDQSS